MIQGNRRFHSFISRGSSSSRVLLTIRQEERTGQEEDREQAFSGQGAVRKIGARPGQACESGKADWRAIRAVKDSVSVPVVANGDLAEPAQLSEMLALSGADAVMIGRGAYGRPWQPGAIALFNLPAYRWLLSAHDRRVHNVRRFTGGQARALLVGHGFRVLRSSYWNTLLFPLMLLHRLVGRDDAESDVRDYPRWLDGLFSAALAVERALIGAGISLPFGGSLIILAARDG